MDYYGYPGTMPMRPGGNMMGQMPWSGAMAPQQMPTPQPMQQIQTQQPAFSVRPVTSREEAVAVPTEYFGAGVLMPDLSHGTIYLKQFDQATGSSRFAAFIYADPNAQTAAAPASPPADTYDPRTDIRALQDEVAELKTKIDGQKPAKKGGAE